jgi:hypothetical protein
MTDTNIGKDPNKPALHGALLRRQPVLAGIALTLFLLVYAINASYNCAVKMSGDEYEYLKSAKALMHGSFVIENDIYSLLKAHFPDMNGRFMCLAAGHAGKLVSYCTIGTAEFFAPFCALFGTNVFLAVPIFCDMLAMLCLFFLAYFYFKEQNDKYRYAYALLCVALYGLVIDFHLGIRRDSVGGALTIAVTLIVFLASVRKKWLLWQIALAVLSFLVTIKISYAVLYVPFFLFCIASMKGRLGPPRRLLLQVLIAVGIAGVILTPFFMQNIACTGHWYLLTQRGDVLAFVPNQGKGGSWLAWLFKNALLMLHAQSHVYSLKGTPLWTSLIFAMGALLGLWQERNTAIVRWWIFPVLALFFGLYMTTERTASIYNLYLCPTYYLTLFLCVCGLRLLLAREGRQGLAVTIAVVLTLGPFLALKTFRSMPWHRHDYFHVNDARNLAADVGAVVPAGGVLLCDRYLSPVLDYFSGFHSFPAADLKGGKSDEAAKIGFLIASGRKVYFCDYEGYDFCSYYKPYLFERFAMTPVKTGQVLHHFSPDPGAQRCNIYQLALLQRNEP